MAHLQFVQSGQSWWMGSEEVVMRQLSEGSPPKPFCLRWQWCWRCCCCWPRPQGPNLFYLWYWWRSRVPVFLCLLCKYVWCGGQAGGLRGVGRYLNIWHGRRTGSHEKGTVGDIGGKIWIHLLCGSSVNFGCLHITSWFIPPAPA